VGLWLKDVAPSPELRKWFGHAPVRWRQFQKRYRQELQADAIQAAEKWGKVTLVYAARDRPCLLLRHRRCT
jgi:uncharacterized protein YeaO (DUF488 family)